MKAFHVALFVLGAWLASVALAEDASAPDRSSSLHAALIKEATGEPVLLMLVPGGSLIAVTPSGAFKRTLSAGPIDDAIFDPPHDIVWLRRDDRVEALELRKSAAAPIVIADRIPVPADFSVVHQHGEEQQVAEKPSVCEHDSRVVLQWTSNPALTLAGLEDLPAESRPRIVNGDWLKRNEVANEQARVTISDFWNAPADQHIRVKPRPRCEDKEDCGRWVEFGASHWRLVLVKSAMGGDCRQFACLLHDPGNGQFASPPGAKRWGEEAKAQPGACGPYWFDASGKYFAIADRVCQIGGTCRKIGGRPLGWLGGTRLVGSGG